MLEKKRRHGRINKPITIQFCFPEVSPDKWDMSVIENISIEGIKFIAPTDLDLSDKIVHLKIKIPELMPHILDIEAIVLNSTVNAKQGFNTKFSEVRAKFTNLSEVNKKYLSILDKMIDSHKIKNTTDTAWEKI